MRPSIRSRVVASAIAFVLGFGVANYGILRVPGRDRWLWFAVAIVLMITSVVGVLMADSRRRLSMWSVLGVEVLALFTFLPLLWTFTLATSTETLTTQSLLPHDIHWGIFRDVLNSDTIRHAAVTSLLVSLIAMRILLPYIAMLRWPLITTTVLALAAGLSPVIGTQFSASRSQVIPRGEVSA